ncbi:1-phosphofructokinase family hexose kinase [Corynebacterium sp. 335C]
MILTLTANPSIDRTCTVTQPLERGGVYRLSDPEDVAGGKGINVAGAAHLAGRTTMALYPASRSGRFTRLVRDAGLPHRAIATDDEARVNLTIVESDGTTTKLNTPGPELTEPQIRRCLDYLCRFAGDSRWVVLAGSLPPGVPPEFYVDACRIVRHSAPGARIAVDTSDAPLRAIGAALASGDASGLPDLLKPNGVELGQLAGVDGAELEERAAAGDFSGVVAAAREVNARGLKELLITLGPAGAILSIAGGPVLHSTSPRITPLSTVGAGDSALAGYILARDEGADHADCLRRAVAYGAAATALPGTTPPRPEQAHPEQAEVTVLDA